MTVGELKKFLDNFDDNVRVIAYNFGDWSSSDIHSVEKVFAGRDVVINVDRTDSLFVNYTRAKQAIDLHEEKIKEDKRLIGGD